MINKGSEYRTVSFSSKLSIETKECSGLGYSTSFVAPHDLEERWSSFYPRLIVFRIITAPSL